MKQVKDFIVNDMGIVATNVRYEGSVLVADYCLGSGMSPNDTKVSGWVKLDDGEMCLLV